MWKKRKSSTTFTFNGEKVFLAASQTLGTVFSYFQTSRIGLTQEEVEARQSLPADMRIIEAKDLFVSQSSLTGESDPIEKRPEAKGNKHSKGSVIELENICFMGSNVVSGSAKSVSC